MGRVDPTLARIWAEIDTVLWEVWDPIGVTDIQEARDEYHGYIYGVYRLLLSAPTRQQIESHLTRIEGERMGLSEAGRGAAAAANLLFEIDLGAIPSD